jgi:hypothetical protein
LFFQTIANVPQPPIAFADLAGHYLCGFPYSCSSFFFNRLPVHVKITMQSAARIPAAAIKAMPP